jgi:hypothetical protein
MSLLRNRIADLPDGAPEIIQVETDIDEIIQDIGKPGTHPESFTQTLRGRLIICFFRVDGIIDALHLDPRDVVRVKGKSGPERQGIPRMDIDGKTGFFFEDKKRIFPANAFMIPALPLGTEGHKRGQCYEKQEIFHLKYFYREAYWIMEIWLGWGKYVKKEYPDFYQEIKKWGTGPGLINAGKGSPAGEASLAGV